MTNLVFVHDIKTDFESARVNMYSKVNPHRDVIFMSCSLTLSGLARLIKAVSLCLIQCYHDN